LVPSFAAKPKVVVVPPEPWVPTVLPEETASPPFAEAAPWVPEALSVDTVPPAPPGALPLLARLPPAKSTPPVSPLPTLPNDPDGVDPLFEQAKGKVINTVKNRYFIGCEL
jgi:hypothetical protein